MVDHKAVSRMRAQQGGRICTFCVLSERWSEGVNRRGLGGVERGEISHFHCPTMYDMVRKIGSIINTFIPKYTNVI